MPQSDAVTSPPLLKVFHVGYVGSLHVSGGQHFRDAPLESDRYSLLWFMAGPPEGTILINGNRFSWRRGDLLLLRPGEALSLTNPTSQEIVWMLIACSVSYPVSSSRSAHWPRFRSDVANEPVIPALLQYCQRLHTTAEPRRTALLSSMTSLLLQLVIAGPLDPQRQGPTEITLPRPLMTALAALEHPEPGLRGLTPRWLAKQAGVTTDHLASLARVHLGTTLPRLVQLQRLEKACQLLSQTSLTIKEVAHSCGFAYPHYLARQFARELDCTPLQYRALPASRRPQVVLPVAATLLRNTPASYSSMPLYNRCGRGADPQKLQRALEAELKEERRAYAGLHASRQRWRPIPLETIANRFRGPGPEGWFGSGFNLAFVPPGEQIIHQIRFHIVDEAAGGIETQRSILLLRSAHLRLVTLPLHVDIPIGQEVRALAVLHACGWAGGERQEAGQYEAEFADGQREQIPLWTAGDPPRLDQTPAPLLQDWWPTALQFQHATARKATLFDRANPLGTIRYTYTYLWRNPRPAVPLKAWHIRTTGQQQATLAVLALSILPTR